MRRTALCVGLMLVLLLDIPVGNITEFEGGQSEIILDLTAPSFRSTVNITCPVDQHIMKATMDVIGIPGQTTSMYPQDLSIFLGQSMIWNFSGTGYGPLGN